MTYEEAKKLNEESYLVDAFGDEDDFRMEANLLSIEALEKQIPMKPSIEIYENRVKKEQKVKVCPRCKEVEFGYAEIPYCDNCGQRIDWSET